jgi:ABC-2 type transport system permease protein
MLPPFWQKVSLFNPVVYLISGFRWTFYSVADVPVWSSVAVMAAIIAVCLVAIAWIFKTGYRLKK